MNNLVKLATFFALALVGGQSALADVIPSDEDLKPASSTAVTGAGLALGVAVISAGLLAARRSRKR